MAAGPLPPPLLCWLSLLLLFTTLSGAATNAGDQLFLLHTSQVTGSVHAYVYTEQRQRADTLPVLFSSSLPAATNLSGILAVSCGQRQFLANASPEDGLRLSLASASPLFARWRYARWMNHSLLLTNTPQQVATVDSSRFRCHPTTDSVLCDAGTYRDNVLQSEMRVLIRPEVTRGVLPPRLYFLLSNGRAAAAVASHQQQQQASLRALDTGRCVLFSATTGEDAAARTFRLCDDDAAYFALGRDNATLVLGGLYWRANFSAYVADGQAAWISAIYVPQDNGTWAAQILAAIAAGLTLFFTYGRWATGVQTPSIGLFLWHRVLMPRHSLRRTQWRLDHRIQLGALLLLLSATACILTGWLGLPASYLRDVSGTALGPNFFALALGLTLFAAVQLGTTAAAFAAGVRATGDCWSSNRAVDMHIAWTRHHVHATAALALAALALVPLAYDGFYGTSPFLLLIIVAPLVALLFHQTYYTVASAAVAMQRRAPNWFRAHAIIQLVLTGTIAGVVVNVFFARLFFASSAYFSEAFNQLGAGLLVALVVVGACVVASTEATTALATMRAHPRIVRVATDAGEEGDDAVALRTVML